MKLVIQRVTRAAVSVAGSTCGSIRKGLVVFLGIAREDTRDDADYLSDKLLGLRIFADENDKMNWDIRQAGGELLIISQFTLLGDCRRGRRPSFDQAAPPEAAKALYDYFVERTRTRFLNVQTGVFQASMQVELVNDGPVTILIDSTDRPQK